MSVARSVDTPPGVTVVMPFSLVDPPRRRRRVRLPAPRGRGYAPTASRARRASRDAPSCDLPLRRRRVRTVLRRAEPCALDELDAVAIGVGDEGDPGQVVAAAGVVRRLLGLD